MRISKKIPAGLILLFFAGSVFAANATSYLVNNYYNGGSLMYFYAYPNGNFTGTVTPSDNGAGGNFSPATCVWSGDQSYKYFTYTNTTSTSLSISFSNDGGLTNAAPVIVSPATGYTVDGPSVNGMAMTFTVTPNGRFSGNVTYSDNGAGGSFSTGTLSWTAAAGPQNVTYTATGASSFTISFSNNAGLSNPVPQTFDAIKNPYFNFRVWKYWITDPTTITDARLALPGQVGQLACAAPANRVYPDDGNTSGQYLYYRTGDWGGRKYAGNWDDVYWSLDGNGDSPLTPHSWMSSTYWGSNGNVGDMTGQLMMGYFNTGWSTDVKKFGVNFTSQSTTGMGSEIANGTSYGIQDIEQNYYFSNCLRAGPVHVTYRDDDPVYMNDTFQAYLPIYFDSMSSSGSECGALTKMAVVGGSLPTATKNVLKLNGLYIPTLLYIWKASLPYDVPYENELKHDIAYCSFGSGTIQGVNNMNFDFHFYDENSHLKNMVTMAKNMTVTPPITLIKKVSLISGTQTYFYKTACLIQQAAGSAAQVRVSVSDSFDLASKPLTFRTKVLYGNPATTVVDEGGGNYLVTVPDDSNLPAGRTTVLFIANNGVYDSNPAVVNVYKASGTVNRRPVFSNVTNQTVFQGGTLDFDISLTDPDGYTTYIYKRTDQPGTITNKHFSWTTTGSTPLGDYPLTLFASDGTTGVASKVITITVNNTLAKVSADVKLGPAPLSVNFSSAGSCDAGSNPLSYLWNFDDGSTSTQANPAHTYSKPGIYRARLTVTGPLGSHTASVVVEATQGIWTMDLNNGWNATVMDPTVWTAVDAAKGSTSIAGDGSLTLTASTPPFSIKTLKAYDLPYYIEAEFKDPYGAPGDGFELAGSRVGWEGYYAYASPSTLTNLGSTFITNIGQTVESANYGAERLTLRVYVTSDPDNAGKAKYRGYLLSQAGTYYFESSNQVYTANPIKINELNINKSIYRLQVWVPNNNPVPTVTLLAPSGGSKDSPNTISIAGTGFFGGKPSNDVKTVKLYTSPVSDISTYTVASDSSITGAVIPSGIPAGSYLLKVANSSGESVSSVYWTAVDNTPPFLSGFTAYDTSLSVVFSEDMNATDAGTKTNYAFFDVTASAPVDISPSSVTLTYLNKQATVTGLALTVGHTIRVTVSNARDLAGNVIAGTTQLTSTVSTDSTPPAVNSFNINSGAAVSRMTNVTLVYNVTDAGGVAQAAFSNDGTTYITSAYSAGSATWTLSTGDGAKSVSAKFRDNAGNWSSVSTDSITLNTVNRLVIQAPACFLSGNGSNVTVSAMLAAGGVSGQYYDKVNFTTTDTAALTVPDYTFAGTGTAVISNISFATLGKQKLTVKDAMFPDITGSADVVVYSGKLINAAAGGTITNPDGTSIDIPAGSLDSDRMLAVRVTSQMLSVPKTYKFRDTVNQISRDFGELDQTTNPWTLKPVTFNKPVKITIPYSKADIGDIDDNALRIFYYDPSSGNFVMAADGQSVKVGAPGVNGSVSADVLHFSTYKINAVYTESNFDNMKAYPSPYKPGSGVNGTFKITRIPADCDVAIYTIAGDKVKALKESAMSLSNAGWVEWDGTNEAGEQVGPGVYMYVVKDAAGNKKTGKFGVIK